MNIGIIGCGLIGNKRARAIAKKNIYGCYDINKNLSSNFSHKFNCKSFENPNKLIEDKNIDIIFICTYHNSLFKYALKCLHENKHIFIEKPGGKNLKELLLLQGEIKKKKFLHVHIGFNHRFHPSIEKAKQIIKKTNLGKLMYIRANYGHGARLNYNKEWRMLKPISGGGELIDQGSHIIDLSRYFMGNLVLKNCFLNNFFWKSKVEDNAFLLLSDKQSNKVAYLHCSCTEWKNKFLFEIFFEKGKIEINGLGGSYGVETLILYKMKKQMGKPKVKKWKFNHKDYSWMKEINYFLKNIRRNLKSESNILNAVENMKIIEECYSKYKL